MIGFLAAIILYLKLIISKAKTKYVKNSFVIRLIINSTINMIFLNIYCLVIMSLLWEKLSLNDVGIIRF